MKTNFSAKELHQFLSISSFQQLPLGLNECELVLLSFLHLEFMNR